MASNPWRWSRLLLPLVLGLFVCALGPSLRPGHAEEAAVSLVDWLNDHGQDATFSARKSLFEGHFPSEAYSGTADQNLRLLHTLQRAGTGARTPARTRRLPEGEVPSRGRRTILDEGWRVVLDTGTQVLSLAAPKDVEVTWQRGAAKSTRQDPVLHTTLPSSATFVSAAMLAQKAKIFDDGLYAAVELAAQGGHRLFPGKSSLLWTLEQKLTRVPGDTQPARLVLGARLLGGGWTPSSRGSAPAPVQRQLLAFWRDARRSKPLGFYTWSESLERIFRQDRLLQTPLDRAELGPLLSVLRSDSTSRAGYRKMLELAEGLTNPFPYADLRPLLDDKRAPTQDPVYFLPPSRSHESELAKRLWGRRGVPAGANLMDALVERVRAGTLSLEPKADSGWYDHQTWSLEPLLRPERTAEAPRLVCEPTYREHLELLFRGVLALMRETHVKQVETPGVATRAMPPIKIDVFPGLTIEPLATHYARRADAYAFVRGVLERAFGPAGLRGVRRQTVAGPVAIDLEAELLFMERLFRGAAATVRREIGAEAAGGDGDALSRATFDAWRVLLAGDPDLQRDVRMMVPVFHDLQRDKTKVWVFLGWSDRPLQIAYQRPPSIVEKVNVSGDKRRDLDLQFNGQFMRIAYPVMAEVYVSRLMNREEFRAHCDRFKTRSPILRNLR